MAVVKERMSKESPYILVADDDPDDLLVFEVAFTSAYPDVRITALQDGDQVLPYLTAHDDRLPELIVLDYKMPRMTGADVLRQLEGDIRYLSIPVVVWTSSGREFEMQECLRLGASKLFVKPENDQELMNMIVTIGDLLLVALGTVANINLH